MQYPKKLLLNYFRNYPYCERMFVGVLEFYEKFVEVKEGSKEGKEIGD